MYMYMKIVCLLFEVFLQAILYHLGEGRVRLWLELKANYSTHLWNKNNYRGSPTSETYMYM